MQNCGMPPSPFVIWAESLSTKTDKIWLKTFFLSLPNFGKENELILSGEVFLLVFIILKFPGTPLPFENLAYANGEDNRSRIALKILVKDENRQINF